jgi:16S rRNA (guanine966-N2)-methyltransferase
LTDRVKQALFASLEASGALDGPFLDLFAGSGAAGIEALSRGAPAATFVERDAKACDVIATNLQRAQLTSGHVVRADVVGHLLTGPLDEPFLATAAVVDPPYGDEVLARAIGLLGDAQLGWLSDAATVVAKHFWRDEPPERAGRLVKSRQRRFGETMLSFYTPAQEG